MSLDAAPFAGEQPSSQTGSMLAFAVGFVFSARAITGLVVVRVLGMEARVGTEVYLGLSFLLLGLACLDAIGSGATTFRSLLRVPANRWVAFFLVFSGCSLAWSSTVSRATSAALWCGLAADVVTVALLLRTRPVTAVSHALMKGFVWSTCFLALVGWLIPTPADLRLGDEEFFNTNQIGNLCAFGVFFAQYLMRSRDGKWKWPVIFLIATLGRSLSKTTIAAFVVSQSVMLIHDRSMRRRTKLWLTAAVVAAILVFWGFFEAYYDTYTAGTSAETLTGRTGIWITVLLAALEQPWIGHGFDSVWRVIPPFGEFEARHAENEIIQQFYTYGVVGLAMLAGIYGSLWLRVRRLAAGPQKIVFGGLLLFIVVRGLAEAEPCDLLLPLWSVVMMATLAAQESVAESEAVADVLVLKPAEAV